MIDWMNFNDLLFPNHIIDVHVSWLHLYILPGWVAAGYFYWITDSNFRKFLHNQNKCDRLGLQQVLPDPGEPKSLKKKNVLSKKSVRTSRTVFFLLGNGAKITSKMVYFYCFWFQNGVTLCNLLFNQLGGWNFHCFVLFYEKFSVDMVDDDFFSMKYHFIM